MLYVRGSPELENVEPRVVFEEGAGRLSKDKKVGFLGSLG